MPDAPSPAYTLVQYVWRTAQMATTRSWRKLNISLVLSVELAIKAGLHFDKEDMQRIYSSMDGGYWFHGESFYALAVQCGNRSACTSYEKMVKRAPFIYDGRRLYVGATLVWPGMGRAHVTSFTTKGIVICTYRSVMEQLVHKTESQMVSPGTTGSNPAAPKKRRVVSYAEIQEAERVRRTKARATLSALPARH